MKASKRAPEPGMPDRQRTLYTGKPCKYCGSPTRHKFAPSGKGGKNTRLQHMKWWVCENGHQLYRKRGQV